MSGVLLPSSIVEPVRCKYPLIRSVNVSLGGAGFAAFGGPVWAGSVCCANANPPISNMAIGILAISILLISFPACENQTLISTLLIGHNLRLSIFLNHLLIENRRVLIGDPKEFCSSNSKRLVSQATLSGEGKSSADVSLTINKKGCKRAMIRFE